MLGKYVGKKCEKRFLCSHDYRAKKFGGKNARNNFSRNRQIVGAKNVGKKSSEKGAKKRFLYPHEYRSKKWGERTRETIIPEIHE